MANLFQQITTLSAEELGIKQQMELEGDTSELALEQVDSFEATDEMLAEADENIELADDIDKTAESADTLGELHEGLEAEASQEGFEGFSNPTMMSARTALRMIARHHHMPEPKVTSAITKQSFVGQTTKVHVANSKVVLAGIKDTLVEMWEKIKAGLKLLWDRVKAFWKKNLSTMGRLKKALVSAKTKAKQTKGAPDFTKEVKAGSLGALFIGEGDVDSKLISDYFDRHATASNQTTQYLTNMNNWAATLAGGEVGESKSASLELGSESKPLVGGFYSTINATEGAESDKGEKSAAKLKVEKHKVQSDSNSDRKMAIASKDQIVAVLDKAISCIDTAMKFGSEFEKIEKDYSKNIGKVNENISKITDDNKSEVAKLKSISRAMSSVGSVMPNLNSTMASLNVKLSKGALVYCKKSMGAYKKA